MTLGARHLVRQACRQILKKLHRSTPTHQGEDPHRWLHSTRPAAHGSKVVANILGGMVVLSTQAEWSSTILGCIIATIRLRDMCACRIGQRRQVRQNTKLPVSCSTRALSVRDAPLSVAAAGCVDCAVPQLKYSTRAKKHTPKTTTINAAAYNLLTRAA
jgi:hypothetical protein